MKKRFKIEDLKRNFNLQLFADGDTGQDGGEGNSGDGGSNKTFTQEELDSIIKGRIAETKKSTQKALLEELGLEKIDDLKAIVKAKKEDDEKSKTELEKLQEQINALKGEKESATKKAKETLMIADFKLKAVNQGLDEKQIQAALKLADMSTVEVKEDGTVEGIEEVIKSVLEAYPFLKGTTNSNIGGGAGGNPPNDSNKDSKLSIGQRLAQARKQQSESTKKVQNHYFK